MTRDVRIASLAIDRPEIHLLVRPDGTTNIPALRLPARDRGNPAKALLDLKVRHFELSNGVVTVDERRIPFDVRGEGVRLLARYERARPRYEIELSSEQLGIDSAKLRAPASWPERSRCAGSESIGTSATHAHKRRVECAGEWNSSKLRPT